MQEEINLIISQNENLKIQNKELQQAYNELLQEYKLLKYNLRVGRMRNSVLCTKLKGEPAICRNK